MKPSQKPSDRIIEIQKTYPKDQYSLISAIIDYLDEQHTPSGDSYTTNAKEICGEKVYKIFCTDWVCGYEKGECPKHPSDEDTKTKEIKTITQQSNSKEPRKRSGR